MATPAPGKHLHTSWQLLRPAAVVVLFVCGGCQTDDRSADPSVTTGAVSAVDDTDVRVTLAAPAIRVVSLVPSATDVLIALGVADRIVGRTDYDTALEVDDLISVGGGLDPSLEVLVAQEPDLVIAWAEAGPSSLRSQLAPVGIAVFGLRTQDTSDVFQAIMRLGHLVGRDSAALELASRLRSELTAIRASVADRPHPSVVYLVETDPPMVAGPGTFITQIIGVAGGRTAFPDVAALWPQVSLEEIVNREPDVLILPELASLSSFVERMTAAVGWRELPAVRNRRIVLMPPELMSRPGPRIAEAARLLRDRLHPGSIGRER